MRLDVLPNHTHCSEEIQPHIRSTAVRLRAFFLPPSARRKRLALPSPSEKAPRVVFNGFQKEILEEESA